MSRHIVFYDNRANHWNERNDDKDGKEKHSKN